MTAAGKPQYAGFALILIGFFLQWPTLVSGLMLPVLLVLYWLLAKREERETEAHFGEAWRHSAALVPAVLAQNPRWPDTRDPE